MASNVTNVNLAAANAATTNAAQTVKKTAPKGLAANTSSTVTSAPKTTAPVTSGNVSKPAKVTRAIVSVISIFGKILYYTLCWPLVAILRPVANLFDLSPKQRLQREIRFINGKQFTPAYLQNKLANEKVVSGQELNNIYDTVGRKVYAGLGRKDKALETVRHPLAYGKVWGSQYFINLGKQAYAQNPALARDAYVALLNTRVEDIDAAKAKKAAPKAAPAQTQAVTK